MQSVNLAEIDQKGKQGTNTQEATRAEALRGLTDSQGRPLGEKDIAMSLNGISKQDEDALAVEFTRFLGSAAVQNLVSARATSQGQALPTAQADDAAPEKASEGHKLGQLLRNLFGLFAGNNESEGAQEAPGKGHGHGHAHAHGHTHAHAHENVNADNDHGHDSPAQASRQSAGCAPCPPSDSEHVSSQTPAAHGAAAPAGAAVAGTNLSGVGKATTLSASAPAAVQRFKSAIDYASQVTGIDANLIAAQIWAESRGNPSESSTNIDGHSDVGLMQISQNTYDTYVRAANSSLPKLNVNDPAQNILAGALELTQHLKDKNGNMQAALNAYVGEGINDKYVPNVMGFYNDLLSGRTMSDEDHV